MGFQGISSNDSMLLNIADIHHSPHEVDRKKIDEMEFDWNV